MKKIILLLLIATIFFAACSIQAKSPAEGEWYCEELQLLLDFSDPYGIEPAKYYHEDGTYEVRTYLRDYGKGIQICSADKTETYLIGKFEYKNDLFTITDNSTGKEYVFTQTGADVIVVKDKSHFVDYNVQENQVFIRCQVTLENSYTSDKKVVLKGDFSEDNKNSLLKEAELQGVQADNTKNNIIVPAGEVKTFEIVFVGTVAGTKQMVNRLLPEIDVEILDSYEG